MVESIIKKKREYRRMSSKSEQTELNAGSKYVNVTLH